MIVKMCEFGTVLGTRQDGRSAYNRIMKETNSLSSFVTFDFSGVSVITNSFSDEVFGRMALNLGIEELKRRTSFKNIDPLWARIVRRTIDLRSSESKTVVV